MEKYKKFKIGDRVSCKHPDKAYDNQGNITPDMIGTIKNFAPKVRIINQPPLFDTLPYFAFVVFDKIADEIHQNHFRGGIDICNLKKE